MASGHRQGKIYLKHCKSKFHSVQTESADCETIEHDQTSLEEVNQMLIENWTTIFC